MKKNYSKAKKGGDIFICLYFVVCRVSLLAKLCFAQSGKTFIWNVDGAFQHVVVLKYIRQALMGFISATRGICYGELQPWDRDLM